MRAFLLPPYRLLLSTWCRLSMKTKRTKGTSSGSGGQSSAKLSHMDIAASTLDKIQRGSYNIEGRTFDLTRCIEEMKNATLFFPENSDLSEWRTQALSNEPDRRAVDITVTERSTLSGARALKRELNGNSTERIGVLSFASAKNPGGGFLTGAQAQVCPFSSS